MRASSRLQLCSALLSTLLSLSGCGSNSDASADSDAGLNVGRAAAGAASTASSGNVGASATGATGDDSGPSPSWNQDTTLECRGVPVTPASASDGGAGNGAACAGVSLEAEAVPVDLFIMMDRSVSMNEPVKGSTQTRWEALRAAVEQFVVAARGSDIRAGIGFFGRSGARDDALDCDAGAYANPSVEIGSVAEVGSKLTAAIDATPPGGLTPTLPALQGALHHAQEWAKTHPGRATSVVLVTDGFPTQCQDPVSVSDISAVAAGARNAAPFVRTFVIGLAAGFNLDAIAAAGGTSHAYLVDEGNVTASFAETLGNISDSRIVCDYELPPPPSDDVALDYDKVQIVYTPASGDAEQVPKLEAGSSCGRNPNGGWYYDNPNKPTHISVCPCSCARFAAGRVDVRLGCEPYIGLR